MKLKNGMFVIAPEGCESYLTLGKKYEVFNVEALNNDVYGFDIVNDKGVDTMCIIHKLGCAHLKNNHWIINHE